MLSTWPVSAFLCVSLRSFASLRLLFVYRAIYRRGTEERRDTPRRLLEWVALGRFVVIVDGVQ
jgi:hypothetical protein